MHSVPRKRRGPIGWLVDLPKTLTALGAANLKRASADLRYFVFMRLMPSAVAICAVLAARYFGVLPARLAWVLVWTLALGTACVCLFTIRDLQTLRKRNRSSTPQF